MGLRRGTVFFFFSCAACVVACSLFTDLSDLDARDPSDSGGSASDATDDAPPSNTNPAKDSAAEPEEAGATDGGACPDPGFCDDFEEGAIGAKWESTVLTTTGTIEADPDHFVSGQRSFRSRTVAVAMTPPQKSAHLRRGITPVPKGLVCTFSARSRIEQDAAVTRWADFFQLYGTGAGVTSWDLNLGMNQGYMGVRNDVRFTDGGCDCPHAEVQFPRIFPVNTWVKVTVETDFKNLRVAFDDQPVMNAPFDFFVIPSTFGVALGLDDSQRAAHDMSFDNLVCRFIAN